MPNADRLIELFTEAKAQPVGPERDRFLAEACPGDPELKAQVISLLQAHEGAGDFLKNTLVLAPAAQVTEKAGDTIGRYKLLQQLGEGGCGVVYMAEQTEPVRRKVALKVIKLGMDTKQVVARFEAERQALALMDHPNIAKIFDAGATETGRPYFVMELVKGIKITDYCDRHQLSTTERLDLFIQVCQAVQHAHQKGIIHRDLKPSNILVAQHDTVAVPKVIDFGIAKATSDQPLTDKTVFTAFEQFVGTPAYMSPEQAQLSGLDIDTRTDIYSLGVLLYELLTGTTPFDPEELLRSGVEAMRRTIREKEPPRPSTRLSTQLVGDDVRSLTSESKTRTPEEIRDSSRRLLQLKERITRVRGDLDWIVMKCLEKERARRYETANGLAADLKRHLNNEPVVARPPSRFYEFQKTVRRHKFGFAATAAILVALAGGVVVSTWQAIEASRARNAEKQQRLDAQTERNKAQTAQKEAEQKAVAERNAKAEADRQRREAQRRLYVSDMLLAQQALAESNLGRARELLYGHWPKPDEPDLRGWEWRYFWKQCQTEELVTLTGHESRVHHLTFSPDGKFLASAATDGSYRFWSLASMTQVGMQRIDSDFYNGIMFAQDGTKLFTTSMTEPFVSVWTVPSFEPVVRLKHSRGYIERTDSIRLEETTGWIGPLVLSPDGRILASMNFIGVVLWDATLLKELPVVRPIKTSRNGLIAFTPDSQRVVFNDARGAIHFWDLATEAVVATFDEQTRATGWELRYRPPPTARQGYLDLDQRARPGWDPPTCTWALCPDGKTLVTSGTDNALRIWDIASRAQLKQMTSHSGYINSVAFSPDGRLMASASADQTVRLWDTSTWQELAGLRGHLSEVLAVAFAPDGTSLASASKDQTIKLWSVAGRTNLSAGLPLPPEVRSVHPTADGRTVLLLRADGTFTLADTVGWRQTDAESLPYSLQMIDGFAISPDGQWVAMGMKGGTVRMLDLLSMKEGKPFGPGNGPRDKEFQWLAFSENGQRLGTFCVECGNLRIWDVAGRQQIARYYIANNGNVTCVSLSADGDWAGVGYHAGDFDLWHVSTGHSFALRSAHRAPARDLVFLPAQDRIVTAGSDGTVKLWSLATQQADATFSGTLRSMNCLAVSPDARLLAAGTGDGPIKLWDLYLQQEVATLRGHRTELRQLAFYRDGSTLVSVGRDAVMTWHAPSLAEIEAAEVVKTNALRRVAMPVRTGVTSAPSAHALTVQQYSLERVRASATNGLAKARVAKALLRLSEGLLPEAAALSGQAVDLSPEEPEVWLVRADVLEQTGDIVGAIALLRQGTDWHAASPGLWNAQARLLLKTDRLEETVHALTRTIELRTNLVDALRGSALRQRGKILERLGRRAEAGADFCRAQGIPVRDLQATPEMLDLSLFYNAALNQNWHGDVAENNLAGLATGVQTLAATKFDVRGLLQVLLNSTKYPAQVNGIAVGRKCRRLHFLHAAIEAGSITNGTPVGSYVSHLDDGQSFEIPLVLGRDLADWWEQRGETNAIFAVAWTGTNEKSRPTGEKIRLFKSTWENPLPDVALRSIDFHATHAKAAPFLIAITAE